MNFSITVNGIKKTVEADPETPVLWVLRDNLRLTGTKYGCGVASCGACTVHINGEPTRSCQVPIEDAEGASITTIEGARGRVAQSVQQAWEELSVVQCGYCQSGQIMSAISLLSRNPRPDEADINDYMWGNACRCATYQRIRAAVQRASEILES
ncbi:Isoquinoline 1-oxidoreductase subunit alpha [Pseudovibrio sp. Ad13]|uniref:(2Fe-2S)-binding protein n=1 Tax=Pseudovibrio sp. Ad13 TaxID=989396 RepID=UPI0007AEDB3B|nr:(2Fe-2S)-binding protein [Pseudovibrio sp. Ad13]KZK79033.1 Isoquinoline 1-oxidoreductase subunit alpha [Pseudovibrio sp. Ad13]